MTPQSGPSAATLSPEAEEQRRQVRRACTRLLCLGAATHARWSVAWWDQQTSLHDARAAICLAAGVPLSQIGPLGHDLSGRAA
jgi:hypothetical protein